MREALRLPVHPFNGRIDPGIKCKRVADDTQSLALNGGDFRNFLWAILARFRDRILAPVT